MVPLTSVINLDGFKDVNPVLYFLLLFLIICSGLFSSAETAYSTASPLRLRNYIENGKKGAKKALYLTENFENTVSTILIGNNIVNIALTSISSVIFITLVANQNIASALNTIVVTIFVLIFGEVLPKQLAKQSPEKFALRYSGLIYYLRYIFLPFELLIKPFKRIVKAQHNEEEQKMTDEELETLIDDLEQQGLIEEDVSDYIQKSLDISDKTVEDIMTPRVDMQVFDISLGFDELLKFVKNSKYTRIPVFKDDKDNIIGKIHTRDIMLAYMNKKTNQKIDISKIVSDITYVPETMKVNDLISLMKETKQQICIVSGEYGGTEGLVTMEDAIEVVFGQIYDEFDDIEEKDELLEISENTYLVSADYNLNDLLDELELPEVESQYSSIAGYINEKLERIPEENDQVEETFVIHKSGVNEDSIIVSITFTVKEVIDRRISNVLVELSQKEREEINE